MAAVLMSPMVALPGWVPAGTPAGKLVSAMFAVDREFGGTGTIASTVKKEGDPVDLPLRRRVRLYRERDGLLVGQTYSDAGTGAYTFRNLDATQRYTAIAYDHEHHFRAVVADNLTPTL